MSAIPIGALQTSHLISESMKQQQAGGQTNTQVSITVTKPPESNLRDVLKPKITGAMNWLGIGSLTNRASSFRELSNKGKDDIASESGPQSGQLSGLTRTQSWGAGLDTTLNADLTPYSPRSIRKAWTNMSAEDSSINK